jgi:hypothetical protein
MKWLKSAVVIGCGVTLAALMGCGSASNNDQGAGFRIVGFWKDATKEAGDAGQRWPTSADDTVDATTFIEVENDLTEVAVNVQRVLLSYYIAGAEVQPPDTSAPFFAFLEPDREGRTGDTSRGQSGGSSLPPVLNPEEPRTNSVAEAVILPPSIITWMTSNSNLLPTPPYTLEVMVTARGTTTAGDVLETNTANYFIEILPFVDIPGTSADSSSASEDEELDEEIIEE